MSDAPTALFVVGAPGAGKTTLVRALLGDLLNYSTTNPPRPKWTIAHDGSICAAGWYVGHTFDGADRVPYNGANAALMYWRRWLWDTPLAIFDGDRFSNMSTVDWMNVEGARIRCVRLDASATTLDCRRKLRGSRQNAAWMKGRETKARRFAEKLGAVDIPADAPIRKQLHLLRGAL